MRSRNRPFRRTQLEQFVKGDVMYEKEPPVKATPRAEAP